MPLPIFSTNSTISRNRVMTAFSFIRMFRVRQCTVSAEMPVFTMRSTSLSVSSWEGSRRIFAEMVISGGMASRRAVRIEQRRSGFVSSAAPMPACVEKGFGQPQLRSKPETSCWTIFAACTASSGSAEPIW